MRVSLPSPCSVPPLILASVFLLLDAEHKVFLSVDDGSRSLSAVSGWQIALSEQSVGDAEDLVAHHEFLSPP